MIIIITGASHTGKTNLAQKLLEKYKYPYLSVDHLKMGLIRSENTDLTPLSDDGELTAYLWPIVREIIKTAIENKQNLIVEGCYIPLDWAGDFDDEYIRNIRFICLVMSEEYIKNNTDRIREYSCVIESRLYDECDIERLIEDNKRFLRKAEMNAVNYFMIDGKYDVDKLTELC